MTRFRSLTAVQLAAITPVALSVLLVGCGKGEADTPEVDAPTSVRVAAVTEEEIARPVAATGSLGSKDEVPLSFKIGGVVARVSVETGQRVKAGDALAALDLREIDAAVARARSGAEKAERDLERARRLYTDSVFTLSNLQDTETGAQVARADLEGALVNRGYAVIAAPTDGVILRRGAEAGQMVGPGQPILVFGSDARGKVLRVGVSDRDLVRIRRGDAATVRFEALPGQSFSGSVTEVSAAAEPGTGTYLVEVAVTGTAALASGFVGSAEIHPRDRTRATLIPMQSLVEADRTHGVVFTLASDGAHVERREVTIAFIDGDRVAIAGGLEGVQSVITDGAAYLEDGALVRVVP